MATLRDTTNTSQSASELAPATLTQAISPAKTYLDRLPTEILNEIINYLPDPGDAVHLGSTCRALQREILNSNHFWWKVARDKKVHRDFLRYPYAPTVDYQRFVVRVARGEIRTTCELCFKARYGRVRKCLGERIICPDCMDERVVLAEVVERIPNFDPVASGLQSFKFLYNGFDMNASRQSGTYQNVFWLPSVIRHVKATYGLIDWKKCVGDHMPTIGPLVGARQNREYLVDILERVRSNIRAIYLAEYDAALRPLVPLDRLEAYLTGSNISTRLGKDILALELFCPAEGQTDRASSEVIERVARMGIVYLLGPRIQGQPKTIRQYDLGHLWLTVTQSLTARFLSANKRWGRCRICVNAGERGLPGQTFPRNIYNFIHHIQHAHPIYLLRLDVSLMV
ncbi:hypothetical protein TWF694_009509 [Orbilia ellipsospora]|uniref:F-box domain-containing protein n=1 Tax=Orbilia ellipsospora TaxID=2528407 RepID=A0AAV9XB04_9PEZI